MRKDKWVAREGLIRGDMVSANGRCVDRGAESAYGEVCTRRPQEENERRNVVE